MKTFTPLMAKIEFDTDLARERAAGLTYYTREIQPSGRCCWIVPVEMMAKIVLELAEDGFQVKARAEVYG